MEEVYIGLGSNLGDSASILANAQCELSKLGCVEHSPLYLTSAVSPIPQPPYLNGVSRLYTELSPYQLLWALQKIEKTLGKITKAKNAPRYLDLDILFYGDLKVSDPLLTLPHPGWKQRLFVLVPLSHLTSHIEGKPLYPLIRPLLAKGDDTVALYKPPLLV